MKILFSEIEGPEIVRLVVFAVMLAFGAILTLCEDLIFTEVRFAPSNMQMAFELTKLTFIASLTTCICADRAIKKRRVLAFLVIIFGVVWLLLKAGAETQTPSDKIWGAYAPLFAFVLAGFIYRGVASLASAAE